MSEEIARIHQPAAEISEEALKRAEELIEQEEGVQNKFRGRLADFITAVAVLMSLFHLYAAYQIVRTEVLRATHVSFVLFLCFLIFPVSRRFRHRVMAWDWALAALGVAIALYLVANGDDFFDRSILPNSWDVVFGVALIVLVLEAMRRATGWIMPAITFCFLLYAIFGPYLPAPWTHKGYEIPRLIGHMYMTLEGIYGVAVDVSSSLIILFTVYGAFLQHSGAGKFYIDFSFSAMGGKPTGAGRTVVLASFLLGGPSGSGVATTVTLGSVAYPMLTKVGYGKDAAGGLLAAGGLGAIISPPVLGAAAFLIAEFLKISYLDVILMATIPTCLYYLALFAMVEIDVRKFGMKDVTFERVESAWSLSKKYWFHFLSLVSIVVFMLWGFSPVMAVFWATLVSAVTSFLRADTALIPYQVFKRKVPVARGLWDSGLVKALAGGSLGVLNVAATCAGAGIIVGTVTLTGLGLKFSSIVLDYAGGSLLLTAIYTSLIVWIVGLAVPVTASYIICAVIAAPAMIKLGVPDFAAHMFIFYYAVLSEVSPPTARSPFAAAAITGGDKRRERGRRRYLGEHGVVEDEQVRREIRHAQLDHRRRGDDRADDVARRHRDGQTDDPDDERGVDGGEQQRAAGVVEDDRAELEAKAGEGHRADDDAGAGAGGSDVQHSERAAGERLHQPGVPQAAANGDFSPENLVRNERGVGPQEARHRGDQRRPEHRHHGREAPQHEHHDRHQRQEVEPVFLAQVPRRFDALENDVLHTELAHVDLDHGEQREVVQAGRDRRHQDHVEVRDLEELGYQEGGGAQHRRRNDRAEPARGEQAARRVLAVADLGEHRIGDRAERHGGGDARPGRTAEQERGEHHRAAGAGWLAAHRREREVDVELAGARVLQERAVDSEQDDQRRRNVDRDAVDAFQRHVHVPDEPGNLVALVGPGRRQGGPEDRVQQEA